MSHEMPEAVDSQINPDNDRKLESGVEIREDPEISELKTKVTEQLKKVREGLEFMHRRDRSNEKLKEDAQRLGNQAPPHLMEGYSKHKTQIAVMKGMLEDLESAEHALEQGRKNITPFDRVTDVLSKHIKRWNEDFELPDDR